MRRITLVLTSCAAATALVACSASGEGDEGASTPEPTVTGEPSTPGEGDASPTPSQPSASDPAEVPTDAPAEVMLAAEVLGSADQPREETDGPGAWRLPEACGEQLPEAVSMRTLTQGTGEFEEPVGVHQVAVFADADAAVAAADELIAAMQQCAEQGTGETTLYVAEEVEVGAQGSGLATDYYGVSTTDGLDEAMGTYLASTRRGSAVTLVAAEGGEGMVATARERIVEQTAAAWELLCRYDSEGC